MGTITPNSSIYLCKGVPLDKNYTNTYYALGLSGNTVAEKQTAQANLFITNYSGLYIEPHSYQRVSDGVLRVKGTMDALYNINYMVFKNAGTLLNGQNQVVAANYPDKWFFAFVTNVEYVNDQAINVYYEIDVLQTWLFEMVFGRSMVLREHSTTDAIGDFIQPEPVNISRYDEQQTVILPELFVRNAVCIATTTKLEGEIGSDPMPNKVGGIYSGVKYYIYNIDNQSQLDYVNDKIQTYIIGDDTHPSQLDSVVAIFMIPYGGNTPLFDAGKDSRLTTFGITPQETTLVNGYLPKNKKLFTYPYNYFILDCVNDSHEYRYEWFEEKVDGEYQFNIRTTLTPDPDILISPNGYRTSLADNVCESITMTGFPQTAFTIDSYRAWLAQKSTAYNITQGANLVTAGVSAVGIAAAGSAILSGGLTTPLALAAAGSVGSFTNAASNIAQEYNQKRIDTEKGSVARGNTSSASLMGARLKRIYLRKLSVSYELAEVIDNFFTKYGYACNKIKIPNISSRPHWNYIQTEEANIFGNINSNDLSKIKSIFDKGVTFWKSVSEIGNYSLNNAPS